MNKIEFIVYLLYSHLDCNAFISLSSYNRYVNYIYSFSHLFNFSCSTCESEVPYDNVTDLSVLVHFEWNRNSPLKTRCFCSAAIQSLLIPEPFQSVLTSGACDNNENSTIYCAIPCITTSQNELSCDENCKAEACFVYGKMPYILSNQRQLYLLISGINCNTIKGHARELCDVLFTSK